VTANALQRLAERAAVITGAGHGIGRAIALAFAREGARVQCLDLDESAAAAVAAEIGAEGGQALHARCDVRDAESVAGGVHAAVKTFGGLDIAVANAATMTPFSPVDELSEDDWLTAVDVNLSGVFRTCKYAIPHLKARGGGTVIITASQMGRVAYEGQAAYCATKGALIQLAKVMALDHAADNIRVNTLSPGGTATRRLSSRFGTMEAAEARWGAPMHPLGRLGTAEEMADGAVFLASEESSFMTGADLLLDGGYSAR
jgi:NAD(P)-dependent dehydrogenase (short-subunit alcohol dehydrogenase family)